MVLRRRRLTVANPPHLGRWRLVWQAVVVMLRRGWEWLHRMLIDVLLRLRVTAMWSELYWYVVSRLVDVGEAGKTLKVQLQVVVGPTALPAVLLVLKVGR
jgi:hypothetical protein